MTPSVRQVAQTAESSDAFEALARAGYAANGTVHVLIGVLVLTIAAGGGAETDQSGAFRAIAAVPAGFVALWVLAVALWALGAWHVLEGLLVRRRRRDDAKDAARRWGRRVSEWGQGIVFLALGGVAASAALGASPNGEEAAEHASGGLLAVPGGPLLLGAVGLGIGVGGVAFVVMGVRRSFRSRMSIPPGALGIAITTLGAVGFVAKGFALGVVGVLIVVASVTLDPGTAGGLDGAIQALVSLAFGRWLAGAVGVGFIAYGVFCFFRARYARL